MTDPSDPYLGTLVDGRYRIDALLGAGGMGAVYLAEHVLIKRQVALKTLLPDLANDPKIVARFKREALAATAIGNEHIVEVTDMGRFPDGSFFIVLEYLDGHDLEEEIKQGTLPISRIVHIVSQACDGLTSAHEKGIVHRDLKPANLMLVRKGEDPDFVKILDFGISKFREPLDDLSRGLTKTGAAIGTPYYMPREQLEGSKEVDHRVDLYALGVILYQALSGRLPFTGDAYSSLVINICTTSPLPLQDLAPRVPDALADLVHKLLSRDPEDRLSDCASLRAALEPFAQLREAGEGAIDETYIPTPPPKPPGIEGRPVLTRALFGVAAFVAALAGVVYTLRTGPLQPVLQVDTGTSVQDASVVDAAAQRDAEPTEPEPTESARDAAPRTTTRVKRQIEPPKPPEPVKKKPAVPETKPDAGVLGVQKPPEPRPLKEGNF